MLKKFHDFLMGKEQLNFIILDKFKVLVSSLISSGLHDEKRANHRTSSGNLLELASVTLLVFLFPTQCSLQCWVHTYWTAIQYLPHFMIHPKTTPETPLIGDSLCKRFLLPETKCLDE
jgi:hypothetical protein